MAVQVPSHAVHADGSVSVQLGEGHPGLEDPEYRERRDRIATAAAQWEPGDPAPLIDYTDDEHEVWRVVCADLHEKHRLYACREYLDGKEAFGSAADDIEAAMKDLLAAADGRAGSAE